MITDTTFVSAVVSMIVADSSPITPIRTKHHVTMTLVRISGAVMRHNDPSRVAPKMRPGLLESGHVPPRGFEIGIVK